MKAKASAMRGVSISTRGVHGKREEPDAGRQPHEELRYAASAAEAERGDRPALVEPHPREDHEDRHAVGERLDVLVLDRPALGRAEDGLQEEPDQPGDDDDREQERDDPGERPVRLAPGLVGVEHEGEVRMSTTRSVLLRNAV